MRTFIVRPFGTRKGIDFNQVEQDLIGPALDAIGAQGRTTGEILEAGNIRIDMFQQLLVADLIVADITTNNPNAFYELGIRHALQEKRTYLIRAKLPPPATVAEAKEADVPFDLKTDRYLEYDPADLKGSLSRLTNALQDTIAAERQDSPVFLSLPNLKSQRREDFLPVPLDFGEEVQRAEKESDARKLTLLGLEAPGFVWESTGLRVVGRALMLIKRFGAAKTAWESLRNLNALDLEANTNLGNIYQRLDDLTSSDQALERALTQATRPMDLAELHGQLGRNKKTRWVQAWNAGGTLDDKARRAFDSSLLDESYEQYLAAYKYDLNSYYPGLNALALAVVKLDFAGRFPDIWNSQFSDDDEASRGLQSLQRKRDQLANALQLRLEAASEPMATNIDDPWLLISAGDLSLLTDKTPRRAVILYKKAAAAAAGMVLDAARRQLQLYADLGVLVASITEALRALPPDSGAQAAQPPDRVLLFTGHRIDSAKRDKPRFPPDKEAVARDAIRKAVQDEKEITKGSILGIAGGANGGDILFHEVCRELGIDTEIMLALPEEPFIEASVDSDDKSWVKRFQLQMDNHQEVPVLSQTEELPKWLKLKKGYDIWQRNNLWLLSDALCRAPRHLTLIALWDGESGDGPGGTQHMVNLARERGARVVHLDTKILFA